MTVLVFLGAGCAAPTPPVSDVKIESLQRSDVGFTAVATRGDARITIIVSRPMSVTRYLGRPTAADLSVPSFTAVLNRSGFPFLSSGDTQKLMDSPEAKAALEGPSESNLQAHQLADLKLAEDAAQVLRDRPEIDSRYQGELESVYNMAVSSYKSANMMLDGSTVPEPTPDICDIDPALLVPGEYERLCPSKSKR
jgi:hypothetical protein